jgi:cell division septation protein DedD
MEEQTTWKGHTFTLLVFTGIVVLCSIFFIFGMLVGRAEAQKIAGTGLGAAGKNEAKAAPKEEKPDFTFYDSVKKEDPAVSRAEPAKPDPAPLVVDPPKKAAPEPPPPPQPASSANAVNYQIGAVRKSSDAEKLLNDVKKKGFRGVILAPSAGEANPFFRVQVGPFADVLEAQDAKKKLESAGYQPILKK